MRQSAFEPRFSLGSIRPAGLLNTVRHTGLIQWLACRIESVMEIARSQRDVREIFLGGFAGQMIEVSTCGFRVGGLSM